MDFLREVLKDGTTPAKSIQAEAKDAGVSQASLRRASDAMAVIKTKTGSGWYWKLPHRPQADQDAQHAQHLNVSTLSTLNELDPEMAGN